MRENNIEISILLPYGSFYKIHVLLLYFFIIMVFRIFFSFIQNNNWITTILAKIFGTLGKITEILKPQEIFFLQLRR